MGSPPSLTISSSPASGSEENFNKVAVTQYLIWFYKFYQESSRADTAGVVVKLGFAPYINKHYCIETFPKTFKSITEI